MNGPGWNLDILRSNFFYPDGELQRFLSSGPFVPALRRVRDQKNSYGALILKISVFCFTHHKKNGHSSLLDLLTSRFQDFENAVQVVKRFEKTLRVQMQSRQLQVSKSKRGL